MLGTHHFMPAHPVPLVEVVLGADSDPVLGRAFFDHFAAIGRKPVLVKRDIAVRYSFGFRYATIAPVMQKEISGWDSTAEASRRRAAPSTPRTAASTR